VGRIRTASRAFVSVIDRVTPIEPRSCSLSCKFALEYGHSSTATYVAKIWWHFHLSLRSRENRTKQQPAKEQGPPHRTYLLMSCSEIVDDKRAQYKTVNSVKKSIKVTSEVLRKRKLLVHGLLLTAISCRKVEQKELSWKVKQSVYIKR